ncbi:hypothetical protein [Anaerococcus sp. Marseille-Q7828]|uniref:hypothetical protein n=1 Tax=Anaerococcus sp. Marseille-Q7828 TaxID=3036300 RepID=UPI0024AD2151|nr:hypothetical protein [Anaerococcus sp. Marseille-Q7828]
MNNEIIYLPVGVGTFDMKVADEDFKRSVNNLSTCCNVIVPDSPLLSITDLAKFLEGKSPDLVIFQNLTFANSDYMQEVVKKTSCPILIWTLKERYVDGGRLRLNSLTGAYSASNLLYMLDKKEKFYIYAESSDKKVSELVEKIDKAITTVKELNKLNIATVGFNPDGFGFGQALSVDLLKTFGANLKQVEVRELMERAESYKDDEYRDIFDAANVDLKKYKFLESKQIDKSARLYKAYKDYITENNIGALASRCWPDYFVRYEAPVCGILSVLNDQLIAAACEGDVYGALSMFIGNKLSDKQLFFGDPVHIDNEENLIYFWHCGMGACSLAANDNNVGVHPNRKMGPTMEFVSKPSPEATIFRVGRTSDGEFRFFISKGSVIEKEKPFLGTSSIVKLESPIKSWIEESVNDGREPHFTVIYKDVVEELKILSKLLGINYYEY